jgi:hypothetical protein
VALTACPRSVEQPTQFAQPFNLPSSIQKRCDPFCGDAHRKATRQMPRLNTNATQDCSVLLTGPNRKQTTRDIGGRALSMAPTINTLWSDTVSGELKELESPSFFFPTLSSLKDTGSVS